MTLYSRTFKAKRGFFGRHLLLATVKKHTLELSGRRQSLLLENRSVTNESRSSYAGLIVSNNRTNFFVRFVYFLNVAIVLAGLSYITVSQENGKYRCNTITVTFDEEIWEHARVLLPDGNIEERLLIYSYFNGKYRGESSYRMEYLLIAKSSFSLFASFNYTKRLDYMTDTPNILSKTKMMAHNSNQPSALKLNIAVRLSHGFSCIPIY